MCKAEHKKVHVWDSGYLERRAIFHGSRREEGNHGPEGDQRLWRERERGNQEAHLGFRAKMIMDRALVVQSRLLKPANFNDY